MANKIYKYNRAKRENAEAFKIVATYCVEKGLKTVFEVIDDSKKINVDFKEKELRRLIYKENAYKEENYEIDEEKALELAVKRVESRKNTTIANMTNGGKNFVPGFLDKIATSIVSSEEFGNAVEIEKEVKAETRKETIVLYNNPLSKKKKGEKRRRIYASVK